MEELSLPELIGHICKRPSMYTGGSVKETLAFIDGYRFGNTTPISGRIFDRYVCIRHSFPDNYMWTYVINTCAKDERAAMQLIEETTIEFVQLREIMSDDEIIQYASVQIREEGEAEKVFREFDKAILSGDESLIKSLIEEHKDAHILWQGVFPRDVANHLDEISSTQPIKSIPISEDGKKLNIIAQGWPFPIEMNFKSGEWKINADRIIELR